MSHPSTRPPLYKGYRFPPGFLSHCVWLYYRFSLSLRDVPELMLARRIVASYEAVRLWTLRFGTESGNTSGPANDASHIVSSARADAEKHGRKVSIAALEDGGFVLERLDRRVSAWPRARSVGGADRSHHAFSHENTRKHGQRASGLAASELPPYAR
jgi:hypothetical protein